MSEWVEINCDNHYVYTDVMFLGCIGLIRTYKWCAVSDTPVDISIIEIDAQSARLLVNKFKKEIK
jgi:hypothetical protein